jgi:hypothetical protein
MKTEAIPQQPTDADLPKPTPQIPDRTLTPILIRIETKLACLFHSLPWQFWVMTLVVLLLVIVSPLAFFGWYPKQSKELSETIKNVFESTGLLVAVLASAKWVYERRDRATALLLELEKKFQEQDVVRGKTLVDCGIFESKGKRAPEREPNPGVDALLRFYVILYDVYLSQQVPPESLNNCFGYWIAHYYRVDRPLLRRYIDEYYPTISAWLRSDFGTEGSFFRPKHYFMENEILKAEDLKVLTYPR